MNEQLVLDEDAALLLPTDIDNTIAALIDMPTVEFAKLHAIGNKTLLTITYNTAITAELKGKNILYIED